MNADNGRCSRLGLSLLIASAGIAGCATPAGSAAGRHMTADEAHRYCVGQMYSDRTSRGRSAVNWRIYDYCMKRHG